MLPRSFSIPICHAPFSVSAWNTCSIVTSSSVSNASSEESGRSPVRATCMIPNGSCGLGSFAGKSEWLETLTPASKKDFIG